MTTQEATIYEVSNNGVTFKVRVDEIDGRKTVVLNPDNEVVKASELLKFAEHEDSVPLTKMSATLLRLIDQNPEEYCMDKDTNEVVNFHDAALIILVEELTKQGVKGLIQEREGD